MTSGKAASKSVAESETLMTSQKVATMSPAVKEASMTSGRVASKILASHTYAGSITRNCSKSAEINEPQTPPRVVVSKIMKRLKEPSNKVVIKDNLLFDHFVPAVNQLKQTSNPYMMSVMMTSIESDDRMAEFERKLEQMQKAIEDRDLQIAFLKKQLQDRETIESNQTLVERKNDKGKNIVLEEHPQNSASIGSLSIQQLHDMITNTIRVQYDGPTQSSLMYSKPYTKRIDNLRMPAGYVPPKFQQFDGKGNPKQHVAHFIETCETAGTRGDLIVRQFVRTLKGNAFDWYTDLEAETIDSWEELEKEFLNRFYSTRRTISMIELTNTNQRKGEPVVEYINRWRALSLDCRDHLTEMSAIDICIQGMDWKLLYILKAIKPRTFEELATRAHDMELSIASRDEDI